MKVTEIWRYPVKSMAGERLDRALVGPLGIEGDRLVHVEDSRGRLITSRTHPRLLALRGALGPDGEPRVDGRPWDDPEITAKVVGIVGRGARLVRHDDGEGFDVLPLLVATDGAIAAFGHDRRRLRPNLVVGGVEGLSERGWAGRRLRVGAAIVGIQDLRQRCIMTSYDPDTQAQDTSVTRGIYERFGGRLALDCFVLEGGPLRVGDEVQLEQEPDGLGSADFAG